MPMNDLPPWLSGEQDRGFLAGAQLGISAARTGTDIAATRQQMSQSAELQPFRVAAADIANRLNRQQFDLGTALFPLKVQQAELANQMAGLQIVEQGLGNQVKSAEVADLQVMREGQAKWMTGDTKFKPQFLTKQGQAAWETWVADSDYGRAKANENAAIKQYETGLVTAATELLKSGIDPYDYDSNGRRSTLPNPEKIKAVVAEVEKRKRENVFELFKLENDERAKREQENIRLRGEAQANAVRARAEAVDLNASGLTRDQLKYRQDIFTKRFNLEMKQAQMTGDYSRVNQLLDDAQSGKLFEGGQSKPESSAAKTYRDAIQKAQEEEISFKLKPEGERKQKDKERIESDLLRAKALLAQEEGRVLPSWTADWSQIEKLKLQEGDEVLVPADPDSANPIANKGPHIIRWPGNEVMKKKWAKVKGRLEQDAAIKSRKQAEDKAEFERRTSETGAMWMRSGRTGAF